MVRLTGVVAVAPSLAPLTVTTVPDVRAIYGTVVMVMVIVDAVEPLRGTNPPWLKLQVAPAGRLVQLVEPKLTVPVKPGDGVTVITVEAGCPAGTLTADGVADRVNGTVTLTVAGEGDVEFPLDVFPL
jgi:hypothetical protein